MLKAFNTWKINGLPQNPTGWLFTVARNKAIDVLRQQKRQNEVSINLTPLLQSEYSLVPTVQEMVNTKTIDDDQLRMMFVCCHPSLSAEAQVALILKTLCGFSVAEIAKAFVSSYDTIEKRLYRARQSFRDNAVSFDLPPEAELQSRMDNVLMAVYLLFNEGYNSTSHEDLVRSDLIYEAMRLCDLVCRSTRIKHYGAHALMALICFTAARNDARLDDDGNILLLKEQDRSKWNRDLILKGISYLEQCAAAEEINKYHLEAVIAYEHVTAVDYAYTKWENILHYYDVLVQINPSPVVELNRAVVIGELHGPAACIEAINSISQISSLEKYYLLPATLGEMHRQLKDHDTANAYFEEAIKLTQSASEKKLLQQKIKGR